MARLHFLPIPAPGGTLLRFPNTRDEDREAVIAGLANHQAVLLHNNGSYLGRHKFIEAAVAVAVRAAFLVDAKAEVREALLEAFEHEMSLIFPATA